MKDLNDQLNALVDGLYAATVEGRALWHGTSEALTYRLERSSGTVLLSSQLLGGGYAIKFLDRDGREVLSYQEGGIRGPLRFEARAPTLPAGALQQLWSAVTDSRTKPRPEIESFLDEL